MVKTQPQGEPLDRRQRLIVMASRLSRTIGIARALAQNGRTVDLTGLDDGIGMLCAQTLDLPTEEGRTLLPMLADVLQQVELAHRRVARGRNQPDIRRMTGGLAMQGLLAVACLAAVLLLILGAGRVARRMPALRLAAQPGQPIQLRGSLALERGRRLHLVEADGHQALVLTGGSADLMISLPVRP